MFDAPYRNPGFVIAMLGAICATGSSLPHAADGRRSAHLRSGVGGVGVHLGLEPPCALRVGRCIVSRVTDAGDFVVRNTSIAPILYERLI
jgi:hypothetical protein